MQSAQPTTSAYRGLTREEAARRLAREGANELPAQGSRRFLRILADVLGEPMFALLLGAAAIYLALGDRTEAGALAVFALFSVSIALVQEVRGERVLDALRDLSSPRALVVRDGERTRIAGREVVREDLIVLAEGDRVPADAWILQGDELAADESLLTGESVPVRKRAAPSESPRAMEPGGEDLPLVYSGTLVVRGNGEAVVVATGRQSAIGRIGAVLAAMRPEAPRLHAQTRRIVRAFAIVGAVVSVIAGAWYGIAQSSWLAGVLSGIAVGMSMLPEEFPLVLAVFLVMGAWRIAQARVLTRRAASIETLGAVTVLCTDKTGTLTVNSMRLAHVESTTASWCPAAASAVPATVERLMDVATLAGLPEPFEPMERAVQDVMRACVRPPEALFAARTLLARRGVTPELLAMTQVWQANGERPGAGAREPPFAAVKGAPEAIVALCAMDPQASERVLRRTRELAAGGLRVLAVAETTLPDGWREGDAHTHPLDFLGLIGFEDPVRDSVPAAVDECRRAGIRVVMITGDYPETARAIARQAGLRADAVVSGTELRGLDATALRARVRECDVFARILPEQKLGIVEALKANGEVVGMTGDGVNDAPSLRAAHIGIAMGGRGTDVAREAASIVLLDDDFGSIVKTIRLGRRIYDNLRKAMGYILAVHVPIAGMALATLVVGGPLILTPALIALLELIIDPVCSIVFEAEPEEADIMQRPPRHPLSHLLDRELVAGSLTLGALALVTVASVFAYAWTPAVHDTELRTLVLVALVTTNVGLIVVHRSLGASLRRAFGARNAWFWIGIGAILAIVTALFVSERARDTFRLAPLHPDDLVLSAVAASAFLVAAWLFRAAQRRSA